MDWATIFRGLIKTPTGFLYETRFRPHRLIARGVRPVIAD
jgi:hypothetical protein